MLHAIIRYGLWPAVIISGFLIIAWGLAAGHNFYLVTLPTIAGAALIVFLSEQVLPYEKAWLQDSDGTWLDTLHYATTFIVKTSATYLYTWLLAYGNVHFDVWPVAIPFYVQLLLAMVVFDFSFFFVHWLSHKNLWMWRFHALHHSSTRLYFWNGDKRHPIHAIMEGLPGITLLAVLGAPAIIVGGAFAFFGINMLLQHCNVDYRVGPLKYIFSVAELHRWHHRTDWKEAQVNYGAWLIVWDLLWGTYHNDQRTYAEVGTVGIPNEPNFPKTFLQQMTYPFRK